jgi:uncharacterized protein YndB with AHSA1/START domain
MTSTDAAQRDFTLTWVLEASAADVFRAWTDPDRLGWYYNPAHPVPAEPIELDLRVGGVWRQYMVIDEDTAYFTGGVYREIVQDEKLVFAWGATDGWPKLDPDDLDGSPTVTMTLSTDGARTEMVVHVEVPARLADDGLAGWWAYAESGWRDTVDRLASTMPGART